MNKKYYKKGTRGMDKINNERGQERGYKIKAKARKSRRKRFFVFLFSF